MSLVCKKTTLLNTEKEGEGIAIGLLESLGGLCLVAAGIVAADGFWGQESQKGHRRPIKVRLSGLLFVFVDCGRSIAGGSGHLKIRTLRHGGGGGV